MWSRFPPSNACKWRLLLWVSALLVAFYIAPAVGFCQLSQAPIPARQTPNEIGTEILHRCLHEAVWGPPSVCTVRQSIHLFGKQISGFGKAFRAGEGSGKLKYSMQLPAGNSMNSLLQVSDGQLLHTIEDIGGVRSRTIIDLDKIRKRLVIDNNSVYDPVVAMYLAVGGQAEKIRKLCQLYHWEDVRSGHSNGNEVWILTGKIASVPQAARAVAATDQALSNPNHSAILPTQVRLLVSKADAEIPYWLYQVEERRTEAEVSPANRRADLHLVTEWVDPIREKIDPRHFEPLSNNDPFSEETEAYLPPQPNFARLPASSGTIFPPTR